jgi:short-subunit dehydrogenase
VQIAGAVIVLTGASGGIGAATARALSSAGATVVGVGRSAGSTIAADVREPAAAQHIVDATLERYGRLDAVIANAGVGYAGAMQDMEPEHIGELVSVNLLAPLLLSRAALPPMRAAGAGHLLYVTSIAGAVGVPHEAVYSATKAALEAFADTLRAELHGTGITVGTVLPGVVDTEFFRARGRPYDRRFPRPMRPERAAAAIVSALAAGRSRTFVPRWLAVPAAVRAGLPRTYRALERRIG